MTYSHDAVAELARSTTGPVFTRGDEGFAAEVAAQNLLVQHDPDLVVGAADETDVAAAVRFAAAHDLPLHVLATGHGGYTPVTEGVLVTTSRLSELTIDAENAVAHIGAGNRWSSVVAAAAQHDLAPITGASGHVGTIGYTLGGGVGPFARTFGFSSDYARGFRVVTAAGEVVSATADEHPDLFWALRGGKGGFGVVTSMDFALVPLERFYGGSLYYDTEHVSAVLRAWAAFTQTAPDEATSSVAVLRFPPLDLVPEPLRGKTVITLRYAYIGDSAEGERVFRPFREVAPAILGRVGEMPASEVSMIHNDPTDPAPIFDRGMLLDSIDDDFVSAFLEMLGPDQQVPIMAAELRHLGGAAAHDVTEGSAVGGRSAGYSFIMIGAPDPALFGTVLPQVTAAITARVAPWVSAENNINFAGDLSLPHSYESCWPAATFARLAEIRAAYDPDTLFPYPSRR
jgi:hypothetical protein